MVTDADLIERIDAGGRLDADDALSPGYRGELMRLMVVFVDSELAGAAGFVDHINSAPGLRERGIAARMVSEKFAHAEAVLGQLERFGVNPALYVRSHPWAARLNREVDLGTRRIAGDKRLNVFHYPVQGWLDAVAMNMLMGIASSIQLAELAECSYAPLAAVMRDVVPREAEHAALGETGLRQAIERTGDRLAAQAAVNYWHPRVAATFGRLDSRRYQLYRDFGLRRHSNADLLARWERETQTRLVALGLSTRVATAGEV